MMTARRFQHAAVVIATKVARDDGPFACPGCALPVILKRGKWKISHFAHKPGTAHDFCDRVNESEAHETIKLAIYEAALATAGIVHAEMECRTDGRIADVVIVGKRRRVAVEVQLSPLPLEDISRRTSDHARAGFSTMWVIKPVVDLPSVEAGEQYPVRAFQREIHEMSAGGLFVYREGLSFDVVHLMGYKYVTRKHLKVSWSPVHLFETDDADGVVIPPASIRWWERMQPKPARAWEGYYA